jgi:hypothetical protein
MVWNGFIWLRIGSIVSCFEYVSEPLDYKAGESLEPLEQIWLHREDCATGSWLLPGYFMCRQMEGAYVETSTYNEIEFCVISVSITLTLIACSVVTCHL